MTTKFNSFDQSSLGAFVESPLGARNRPGAPSEKHVLIMLWIVRDPAYVGSQPQPAVYEADRVAWNTFVADRVPSSSSLSMDIIHFPKTIHSEEHSDLIPPGHELPDNIKHVHQLPRRSELPLMTADQMYAIFLGAKGVTPLTHLVPFVLLLPLHLQMYMLQPALDEFLGRVHAEFPAIAWWSIIRTAEERFVSNAQGFVSHLFPAQ